MINYNDWKTKDVSVASLSLDPLNPRIAEADENLSQRKLIEYLLEYDQVYELAKDIVEKGYFPTEALIGVVIEDKKIILEGNRRLTALKLLVNPDSAPQSYKKKFRGLSDRVDLSLIKKVRVVFAPSREAAAPMILAKHTSTQVKSWSPIMQAKFYKQLLDDGISVKELSAQYSITPSQIKSFLQVYVMYMVACSLDLPEEIKDRVHDSREFPVSTLNRIISQPGTQKFLGIEFDEDNLLVGKVKQEEFKKGYAKIVTDIATGTVDSRTHNKADSISKYISELDEDSKPNLRRKGTFTYHSLTGDPEPQKVKAATSAKKSIKSTRTSQSVIPIGVKCQLNDRRINNVFNELKKLKVATHPNSSGIMLRVLLEMCVGYYLEQAGLLNGLLAKHRTGNRPKGNDWAPTLKQMLGYLLSSDVQIDITPLTVKAIGRLLNDTNIFSADTLDFYVHNRRYSPTEEQLRAFWDSLSEVFDLILVEPVSKKNE